MDVKPIIEIRGLSKRYALGPEGADRWSFSRLLGKRKREDGTDEPDVNGSDAKHIWALRDINLDIYEGERVGIIGRNGAGKSTLLKILSRVTYPTEGEAVIRGRVTSLLEIGTGFNNNATGRENIYLNASLHGLSRREIDDRVEDIVAFAELRRFIDTPIKHYSSGMRSRLAYSVAAHLEPDVLMLDEVLSVGDAAFQQKCLRRMKELTSGGQTLIFVSHSMGSVMEFCSRGIWVDQGRVVADGPTEEVTSAYLAATTGLKSSVELYTEQQPKVGINGYRRGLVKSECSRVSTEQEVARLVSAAIVNKVGEQVSTISVDQDIGINIVMDVLVPDLGVEPAIHVKDEQQQIAFVAAFTAPDLPTGLNEVGRYSITCWVPPHFLNTGIYAINIHLVSPDIPIVRYCKHDDLLSFFVHDVGGGALSARGRYLSPRFPGAVRPLLRWDTTHSNSCSPRLSEFEQ